MLETEPERLTTVSLSSMAYDVTTGCCNWRLWWKLVAPRPKNPKNFQLSTWVFVPNKQEV